MTNDSDDKGKVIVEPTDIEDSKSRLSTKQVLVGAFAIISVLGSVAGLMADSIATFQTISDAPELSAEVEVMRKNLNGIFLIF